ncbi:MAG: secretin [Pseudomonadaceae bacterium]|nr:secretin [Pseudomonadaceae bacterium]
MTLRACLLALTLGLSLPLQAATELIQLNYRMADDVLPLVQTALDGQGKASAYGNQLLINASPDKIAEIRDLLGQLDQAPRRLLISVDTSESSLEHGSGYRVDGSASAGDVEVIAGRGEIQGRDQVRIIRRSTDSRSGGTQQVQATEGYPALIQVGQSVPLTSTNVGPYGQVYQNTEYRNVNQGFYVTATLAGDRVNLSISTSNDRVNRYQPGVIDTQSTDTRVSGRLGEWIPLGGVSEQSQYSDSDFARRHSTRGSNDMSMRIKVEALD